MSYEGQILLDLEWGDTNEHCSEGDDANDSEGDDSEGDDRVNENGDSR